MMMPPSPPISGSTNQFLSVLSPNSMTHTVYTLRPDGIHKGLVARSGSIGTSLDLQALPTLSSDLQVSEHLIHA